MDDNKTPFDVDFRINAMSLILRLRYALAVEIYHYNLLGWSDRSVEGIDRYLGLCLNGVSWACLPEDYRNGPFGRPLLYLFQATKILQGVFPVSSQEDGVRQMVSILRDAQDTIVGCRYAREFPPVGMALEGRVLPAPPWVPLAPPPPTDPFGTL